MLVGFILLSQLVRLLVFFGSDFLFDQIGLSLLKLARQKLALRELAVNFVILALLAHCPIWPTVHAFLDQV